MEDLPASSGGSNNVGVGNGSKVDIGELVTQLQHERLLVNAEKRIIQNFNEKLGSNTEELLRIAWINLQQRVNLSGPVIGSRADCTAEQRFRRAASLANSVFVEAKEILDYQVMVNYSNFLSWLTSKPEQVAQWIVVGETLTQDQKAFSNILHSIVTGLYGSILLPQDTGLLLKLLHYLARLQLVTTDNPRRLLKQGSCAFSKMYFLFHEGLVSARLFLIAALQNPIVKLISCSDTYLDIDPTKALSRFSQHERLEKFGEETSDDYRHKIAQYRKWEVKTLSDLTKTFITSLQDNVHCFPSSLAWLVCRIAHMISKSFSPNSREINAISTDLIFTLFICPAIVQPEPYGICDASISDVARHNLMQVGQIIQMLALVKYETPDPKLMDLYGEFETDCVVDVLEVLLNGMDNDEDEVPIEKVPGVFRNISLFTEQELYNLVTFLKQAQNFIQHDHGNAGNEAASTEFCSNGTSSMSSDPLVVLLNKLPTENEGSPRNTLLNNVSPTSGSKKSQLLHKAKSHLTRVSSANGECDEQIPTTTVLVIPLHSDTNEHIGLLSEEKVLAAERNLDLLVDVTDAPIERPELVNGNLTSGQEKRTRFSHNDEGSIGNTSDNLEVISEAASNHSVASSIELENEDQNDNDNLSDMVSANVSGRGTPNISGRDTPSSQVTENEDNRGPLVEVRQPYLQQPQPLISKQIRSEIDDKFCKFEIKKLLEGDETISIISDTWSTDVLASDSETIDAGDNRQDQQGFVPIIPNMESNLPTNPLLDVSETQSESAWSTDVLASDTERLTEVDNDDIVSVAPSDDTASVARSDDAASVAPSERSELDEQNLNDRRLSTASSTNHFVSILSSQNNSPSAFQEYRRIEVMRRESMPNYATTSKSESHNETQSFERSIMYGATVEMNILRPMSRNCSDASKRDAILIDQKSSDGISKRILSDISNGMDIAGPSGIIKSEETSYVLVKNVDQAKYDDIKTDMQLSNTSLNSSSSGSSNSSETQNKNMTHADSGGSWKNKVWLNGSENNLNATSTPSDNRKMSNRSKPSAATGAIPKSISFDMSAEKGDKEDDDQKSKRGGFFGKLRMNFRHRRGKSYRGEDFNGVRFDNGEDDTRFRRICEYSNNGKSANSAENSEDILAKYRTKQPGENGPIALNNILKPEKTPEMDESQLILPETIDSHSLFNDAKKKLRLVLSNSKTPYVRSKKIGKKHVKNDLESFLQIELAKARDLKQWSIAARVAEALRCIRLLDIAGFNKLCECLKEDYCDRSVYIKYLLRSKQTLLSSQAFLDDLYNQVERDKELCTTFLVAVCVRLFLERQEPELVAFCDEFRKLTLVDEKNDHLALFLNNLFGRMRKDSLWHDASEEQIQMAQMAIERSVMTEVYLQALYPNGDGDRHRDSVLSEHLKKLASTITPGHKYLMISKVYRNECPWLPAQEALQAMAAYRTPRDKLRCVKRCASAIMDLLSLAQGSSATADDIVPVIVYVIIQTNPQDLLSTIQYVNSFYGDLSGEDGYWWTQFCSAVEYTKTMEYTD